MSWFQDSLPKRYEAPIPTGDIFKDNPFLSAVQDIERFKKVIIGEPIEEENGSADNSDDQPSG